MCSESERSARRPDGPVDVSQRPRLRTFARDDLDQVEHGPVLPILGGPWSAEVFREPARFAEGFIEHPAGTVNAALFPILAEPGASLVAVRHVGDTMLPFVHDGDLVVADLDRVATPGQVAVVLYREPRIAEEVARVRLVVSTDRAHGRAGLAAFNGPASRGLTSVEVLRTFLVVGIIDWWAHGSGLPLGHAPGFKTLTPEEVAALAGGQG